MGWLRVFVFGGWGWRIFFRGVGWGSKFITKMTGFICQLSISRLKLICGQVKHFQD